MKTLQLNQNSELKVNQGSQGSHADGKAQSSGNKWSKQKSVHSTQPQDGRRQGSGPPQKGSGQSAKTVTPGTPAKPTEVYCKICKVSHTHLFYCEQFQKKDVNERYKLASILKVCKRCLRLDSRLDTRKISKWWTDHEPNCITDFHCKQKYCDKKELSITHTDV